MGGVYSGSVVYWKAERTGQKNAIWAAFKKFYNKKCKKFTFLHQEPTHFRS